MDFIQITPPVAYENAVISCPFKKKSNETRFRVPSRLALSSSKCGQPDAILDVIDNSAMKPEVNFTVCLHKALFLKYNNSNELVEWIEMNRILGAQRFLIYNFTGGSALTPFLQHYVNEGLVELHDWPVGTFWQEIPEYMGQGALINDCIYKAMYKSKYLMQLDVDEVMVPQREDSWEKALAKEKNCQGKNIMLARNSFFLKNYLYKNNNNDMSSKKYKSDKNKNLSGIEFLDLTYRPNFTHPCPIRTKILMRPEFVRSAGVHYVYEHSDGNLNTFCCLSPDDFRLHHYRFWKLSMKDAWLNEVKGEKKYDERWENMVEHPRMMHFKEELVRNVNRIRQIAPSSII
ncbi:hypothetical protein CAPTEDRAFT_217881 [Capitella teleta]|uniref:Glycosyltransferase family 92 protein n=1 Tax=Capitella teleta TaxID=283909 RepID=R7UBQ0_CAPTE|nr:hypothetical protein CAPTEDRAFT_217881 [Capitella teleta]|eukprot:ELU03800.1 hypothetical protein CAPTEDRAFT_217881 [Capitella teleta]